MSANDSTIVALATSPHPSGVAVIRISGQDSAKVISKLFRSAKNPAASPRKAIYGTVTDNDGKVIDTGLCIFMPGPNSFTGEDVAEIQFHGSPLIAQKIISNCLKAGCLPAEPGEFSKRAFLKGKLDLSQAEAIAELISATSDNALEIAHEQLNGRLSRVIEEIGEPLRDLLAELTAGIDFSDEDIEPDSLNKLIPHAESAAVKVQQLIESYSYGATVKEGFKVLLCGKPNAGKSSLFNLLLGKKRAIVTEISGTTRDILEEQFNLSGYKFILCDSAGVRNTEDPVEKIGVELARQRISWADLIIFIVDANDLLEAEAAGSWREVFRELSAEARQSYLVVNKIDSIKDPGALNKLKAAMSGIEGRKIPLSVTELTNIDILKESLVKEIESRSALSSEANAIISSERHRNCLEKSLEALKKLKSNFADNSPVEIIVEDIKEALLSLEEIIGKTYTEDILGRVFSKFCIGK